MLKIQVLYIEIKFYQKRSLAQENLLRDSFKKHSPIIQCNFADGVDSSTMSLDPIQEEYHPGDAITCAAVGNPAPSLRWVDQENNTIVDSGITFSYS